MQQEVIRLETLACHARVQIDEKPQQILAAAMEDLESERLVRVVN